MRSATRFRKPSQRLGAFESLESRAMLTGLIETVAPQERSDAGRGGWLGAMSDVVEDVCDYVGRSATSLAYGDWTDQKPTALSIGTGVGLGVLGLDLPMDIRDLGHTVTHPELSYDWGKRLAINTIAVAPIIGAIKYSKYLDDVGETAKRAGSTTDSPVQWIPDTPKMLPAARNYEDSATGARSGVETGNREVPVIQRTLPDGGSVNVKFDGLDEGVLLDRKLSITTFPKSRDQAIRQSQSLEENGIRGRWEVPDESQATRARKMLEELGITNIDVGVAPFQGAR